MKKRLKLWQEVILERLYLNGKEIFKLIFILVFFTLSSCEFINKRIGNYYFNKAKNIANKTQASEREIERFYEYITKAVDYKPDLKESLPLVENVTDMCLKSGYIKAWENELKFFKKYIEKNPYAFDAYLSLINLFSLKGDLYNLNNLKEDFEKKAMENKNFKILSAMTEINLLNWSRVYGQLSLNNSYDEMLDYLSKSCLYFNDISEVKRLNDEGFFKDTDSGLYYYFQSSLSDFLSKQDAIKKDCRTYSRISNEPDLSKVIRYTIEGNKYLAKKEYDKAIIYYKSAVLINSNFFDARKNLIEAEFQTKLSLSLMKKDKADVESFVYDKIEEINDIINSYNLESLLPFYDNDRFISELYSLKAAMLMVLVDETKTSKNLKLKEGIKKLVETAIKYNPQNQMAREILSRIN